MPAIPWCAYSKQELVEVLNEMSATGEGLEPLWSESDVYYVSECSCPPNENRLTAEVLKIRDRVARRLSAPPKSSLNPLRLILRVPNRRRA